MPSLRAETYSSKEIEALVAYQRDCEIKKLDLESTQAAYKESQSRRDPEPFVALGSLAGIFLTGILIGFVAGSSSR